MAKEIEGFRLSPQQRRLWLLDGHACALRSQCAVLFEGPLDPARVVESLRVVVCRHEILRTTFRGLPGMEVPLQVITEQATSKFYYEDISGCPEDQHAALVDRNMRD